MRDKRLVRSEKSVSAVHALLRKVCGKPAVYRNDIDLRSALRSQGALARYENEPLGIRPTSINTMKRVAAYTIDGGFQALDALRRGAQQEIDALERAPRASNKSTRTRLHERVVALEEGTLILERTNYLLVQALMDAIDSLGSVANLDDKAARDRRSREARRKLLSMMSVKVVNPQNPPARLTVAPIRRAE